MSDGKRSPTDYRRIRRQGERRLLVGAVVLLVIVGGALIGIIFGPSQVLGALPCLVSGAGLLIGLYLLLVLIERWTKR